MLTVFLETGQGIGRSLRAVPRSLIALRVLGSGNARPFPWFAIIPFFSVLLLSGCGGLSVASRNALVASPSTLSFGSVAIGQSVTAKITLLNQGLSTVQIENLSVNGSSFSIIGSNLFPFSLAPGAKSTLDLQFTPTTSGTAIEPLMLTSSLSTDPSSIAQVTGIGTGAAAGGPKNVQLNWAAPDSPNDIVVGYNVFRSANGTDYQRLNPSINPSTSYTDSTAQSGSAYEYYVESVDSAGASSAPSDSASVTVP